MRIKKLELIRYGKFSDETVDFPHSEHDFHFVVGPNEAGKSTIKTAISELLFGMPHSSSLDFVHHQSELRLGATLESDERSLVYHRSKARKAPLSTSAGEALPADALAPFLGTADKAFFEQMYCLDHTALIRGGQNILDASSDVGQVLFQSAAGIASLGRIRDSLAEEADGLWAKRRSGDRAYYIAQKQLDDASADLKAAMVRTSAWRMAHSAVEDAEARKQAEEIKHGELERKRSLLERIRRVAPHLSVWREKAGELRTLDEVVDLPADAEATLQNALTKLAAAESALKVHAESAEQLQAEVDGLSVDHALLSLQKEIQDLEATRHRCGNHEQEIARLEQEVALLLREVADECAELGWPDDEQGARESLPGFLALQTVSSLMLNRGKLELAALKAEQSVEEQLADIEALNKKLAAVPCTEIPTGLQVSLRAAQKYRDTQSTQRRLEDARRDAEHALNESLATLGKWTRPVSELKLMTLPSTERISLLRAERQELLSRVKLARDRVDETQEVACVSSSELDEFVQAHLVVTSEQVQDARGARDAAWSAIKSGEVPLASGATKFEDTMRAADDLSDLQVGSVTEATQLLVLKKRVASEKDALVRHKRNLSDGEAGLVQFDAGWDALVAAQQLAGMALDDVSSWMTRRDNALQAAEALRKISDDLEREVTDAEVSRAKLAEHLFDAGVARKAQSDSDALCAAAERYIGGLEQAATTRRLVEEQLATAQADLATLRSEEKAAKDAYNRWKNDWAAAVANAGLVAASGSEAATDAAIVIAKKIGEQLDEVKSVRTGQIDVMRSALNAFCTDAKRLAGELDTSLSELDAKGISIELSRRMKAASAAHAEMERLKKELAGARKQVTKARADVDNAMAQLRPLYDLAAVDTPDLLRPLIAGSDRKRGLLSAIEDAKSNLLKGGDGLTLEELASEVEDSDVQAVPAELSAVGAALAESVKTQGDIATELAAARQQLAVISGGANAAIAEARRQEALSAMADAAERFIKVETASTLLRWAIDRYRERRQGPMLARASTIFAELTLGAFSRLTVDYDKQPMGLSAVRVSGEQVQISGMSEGTRDQLYMALRLAALELHSEQASSLPFVADDLFINFDDTRARAGLRVLADLSKRTQVIFLSHHDHLVAVVREVFGPGANIRYLS